MGGGLADISPLDRRPPEKNYPDQKIPSSNLPGTKVVLFKVKMCTNYSK